jgi:hypothetical protein
MKTAQLLCKRGMAQFGDFSLSGNSMRRLNKTPQTTSSKKMQPLGELLAEENESKGDKGKIKNGDDPPR